jgi:endonuclease YncB( thermonuclease family)
MDWEKYNNKTPIFTLTDSFVEGKIVDVYDGDTVKIVLNLPINSQYFRWNCRLSGINTPEIRT